MKTVVIKGTSSAIGRAAALNFVKHGWKVFACMRDADKRKMLFEGVRGIEVVDMDVSCAVF
jgi:NAD(P)-dependent dehydrogenase (short-subunit alcohol dehydrogenase family)